jgi:alkanesulfonate monooxygenase
MDVLWFIPGHFDGRYLGTMMSRRRTSHEYLKQVAIAADTLGYTGCLIPTGQECEDAWMVAASMIPLTTNLKFLVAARPGLMSPTLSARMAGTLDHLSNGRAMINVVVGGDPVELAGDGLHISHDERYDLADEFLTVWRGLLSGETVTYKGKFIDVRDSEIRMPTVQKPHPPVYFGGSSPAAMECASKHVDVYLMLGEQPDRIAEKIDRMREAAAKHGRTMRFGLRIHIIVRDREQDAWDYAYQLLEHADEEAIARAQHNLARFDSTGQQDMMQLHKGSREQLEISPNLWAGIGLVNKGVGTALVGDPDIVAERLQEYAELGIDTFILSSYPHLEEAYRVAELVLPRFPAWQNRSKAVMR